MLFQNPAFLYALPAMLIPVVIHLFSFRRYRKVLFSNVRMLQAIQIETRRQSKIRHWLVLAARMLAIGSLVLAFSRPYFPDKQKPQQTGDKTVVSIFIDNSFSMANESERGILFEQARIKAIEMVAAWPPTTQFRILTNDFSYRGQQTMSQEQAKTYITTLELSAASHTLSQVLIRQQEANRIENRNLAFILSDFQKGFCDLNNITPDSGSNTVLVPFPPVLTGNVLIDSCHFASPALQTGKQLLLIVTLSNHSTEALENLPVRLIINNQQKSTINVSIEPEETKEISIPFMLTEPGFYLAVVETDDHPITFDNRYFMAFSLSEEINVLHLTEEPPDRWIKLLFTGDSTINLQQKQYTELDYSEIPSQNLIIVDGLEQIPIGLNTALKEFVVQGGTLWISPPQKGQPDALNSLLTSLDADILQPADTSLVYVDRINQQADLYRDVFESIPKNADLPYVKKYFPVSPTVRKQAETLLWLQNGQPLLTLYRSGSGCLYLFQSPLSQNGGNFVSHNLIVPTLYNAAYQSIKPGVISHQVMKETVLRITGTPQEGSMRISKEDGTDERIPTVRSSAYITEVFTGVDITTAGFYRLTSAGIKIKPIAFNYPRAESSPLFFSAMDLQNAIELTGIPGMTVAVNPDLPATGIISVATETQDLWKFFIVVALIFLALEVFLLRLPDHLFYNRRQKTT